jgi:hypothetical protein
MAPYARRAPTVLCLLAVLSGCAADEASGPAPPGGLHIPALNHALRSVSGAQAVPFIAASLRARSAFDPAFARFGAARLARLEALAGARQVPLALDVAEDPLADWWTRKSTTISGGAGGGSIAAEFGWSVDDAWGASQNMTWTVMDGATQVAEGSYEDKVSAEMLGASTRELYSYHSFNVPQQGSCIWLKGHTVHSINRPILLLDHWLRTDSWDDGHNPCASSGGGGGSGSPGFDPANLVCYEEWLVWDSLEVYLGDVCFYVSGNMT